MVQNSLRVLQVLPPFYPFKYLPFHVNVSAITKYRLELIISA